jgi:hypothetical protein
MKKVQKGGANDFFDMKNVTDIWSKTIKPLGEEQFRLLPDSILFGSAILAFLTQSFPMVIFFVSMIETAGIQAGLQALFGYLDANRLIPSAAAATPQCRSGFMKSTLESLSFMAGSTIPSAYPSPPLFFLSTACAYVLSSLYGLREELEGLGPEYSARFYFAIVASFFFLLMITFYRLANSCETVGIATMSLLMGGFLGSLLVLQNWMLFGKDSVNLIGVPLLRERSAEKKPIYICPQKVSSS